MKSIILVILLFMTFQNVFSQHVVLAPRLQADSANFEFQQIAQKWLSAYNGTDANVLTPLYSADAQYISGHVSGLVADGRSTLIANFQKGMTGGGHLEGMEILSINRSCNLATILCKYFANNSGTKAVGRTMLILKRTGSEWLIVLHMTVV